MIKHLEDLIGKAVRAGDTYFTPNPADPDRPYRFVWTGSQEDEAFVRMDEAFLLQADAVDRGRALAGGAMPRKILR